MFNREPFHLFQEATKICSHEGPKPRDRLVCARNLGEQDMTWYHSTGLWKTRLAYLNHLTMSESSDIEKPTLTLDSLHDLRNPTTILSLIANCNTHGHITIWIDGQSLDKLCWWSFCVTSYNHNAHHTNDKEIYQPFSHIAASQDAKGRHTTGTAGRKEAAGRV